jgi:2-polyprenyl-3-methyl-5-hydroxy-6-metoxy-1,4-benzoquinol methylase
MRLYWEMHSRKWSNVDYVADPAGLQNVCHAGEPHWLNEYYGYFQRKVYVSLLATAPAAEPSSRALDVGCGAGRWCRILAERGYETVGIDLQSELLEQNRIRFPNIQFVRSAVQDFNSPRTFDLVSSVTVLQHLPFGEQVIAIRRIRELIKKDGLVIALENIADQGRHVFANSIEQWRALFSASAFKCIAFRRYDYSPFTRSVGALRRIARGIAQTHSVSDAGGNADFVSRSSSRRVQDALTWMGVTLDAPIESVLVRLNLGIPTVHCGFLFEAI